MITYFRSDSFLPCGCALQFITIIALSHEKQTTVDISAEVTTFDIKLCRHVSCPYFLCCKLWQADYCLERKSNNLIALLVRHSNRDNVDIAVALGTLNLELSVKCLSDF